MKKLALLILLITGFFSCEEPPIVFTGPQPEGLPPSKAIEMPYRGLFLCESDSALVRITGNTIYKEKTFSFTVSPEEIREMEGVDLIDDQLIIEDWPERVPVEFIDGMVHSSITLKDTLFQQGPGHVLKSFRGHQILNRQLSEEKWEVKILSLDSELNLRLSAAEIPEDLERLNKLTRIKDISTEDSTQYLLDPTFLEFEEILRQRLLFEECDLFTRKSGSVANVNFRQIKVDRE